MIRINLLPEDQRRRKRGREGQVTQGVSPLVLVLLLFIFVGLAAAGHFTIFQPYRAVSVQLSKAEVDLEKLRVEVEEKREEFQELGEIEKKAQNQLEVLSVLDPPDRLLWSEKLNLLSDLRPTDIFIQRLVLTENEKWVETAASIKAMRDWEKNGKKGRRPKEVKRPIITQEFHLYGVSKIPEVSASNSEEEALQSISDFHGHLIGNPNQNQVGSDGVPGSRSFMHGLEKNIVFGPREREVVAGQPVIAFEFIMKTKPLLSQRMDVDEDLENE